MNEKTNILVEEMKSEFLELLKEYPISYVQDAFNEALKAYEKEKGL